MDKGTRNTGSGELTIIYVASLLFMICNMMPNPIVAGYAVYLGAGAALMSIIGGLNSFCALICRPFVGNLSDAMSKRKLMIVGLVVMGAGAVLHLFAINPYMLAAGRVISGIGFTCCSVCMPAWIALKVPRERLGHAIGMYGTMNAISMAIAPTMGVYTYQNFGYRTSFAITSVLTVFAVLSVLFIKDAISPLAAEKKKKQFKILLTSVVPISSIAMLLCIPYFATQAYIVQYSEVKDLNISVGLFFPVYAIVLVITRTAAGRLVDNTPFKYFFWVAMGAMTAFPLIMNVMDSNLMMFAATVCLSLGYGIIYPVCQAKAILIAGPGNEGMGNSTFFMGLDIGVTLGGVLGGVLFSKLPVEWFYPSLLFVIPVCIVIYFAFIRNKIEE